VSHFNNVILSYSGHNNDNYWWQTLYRPPPAPHCRVLPPGEFNGMVPEHGGAMEKNTGSPNRGFGAL